MDIEKLAAYIRKHGLPASVVGDEITTLDEWTQDGELHSSPIRVDGNFEAVRSFLGY